VSAPPRITALLVTSALALSPAAALAQNGAGDEQYSDPFSGSSTPSKPKTQSSPTPAQPAPHQQVPSSPQATPATPAPTAAFGPAASAPGAQLPRTGADVLPLVLLGVVLLGAGVALLRRRGAHDRL
jgi:LPXTG-motif cell wall-anchored protein